MTQYDPNTGKKLIKAGLTVADIGIVFMIWVRCLIVFILALCGLWQWAWLVLGIFAFDQGVIAIRYLTIVIRNKNL